MEKHFFPKTEECISQSILSQLNIFGSILSDVKHYFMNTPRQPKILKNTSKSCKKAIILAKLFFLRLDFEDSFNAIETRMKKKAEIKKIEVYS